MDCQRPDTSCNSASCHSFPGFLACLVPWILAPQCKVFTCDIVGYMHFSFTRATIVHTPSAVLFLFWQHKSMGNFVLDSLRVSWDSCYWHVKGNPISHAQHRAVHACCAFFCARGYVRHPEFFRLSLAFNVKYCAEMHKSLSDDYNTSVAV